MEKLILKKIKIIVMSISVIIFLMSSISIVILKNKSAKKELDSMISEIERTYEENSLNMKSTEDFFEDDYLNRAYAIDYILSNNPDKSLNNDSLKKIKELMEVESVHIVDKNGVIALSSNYESIGINLLESKQSYPFWNLINGRDDDGEVVQLNAKSIVGNKDKIYIGVKSTLEDYSLIQIGLDIVTFKKLTEVYSIEYIINNTPTAYEKSIFLVNKSNGKVEAITKNNEQELEFNYINNSNELFEKLYDLTEGKIIKVNDKYRFVKTKIMDDYIIGAYIDIDTVYNTIIIDIVFVVLAITIVFLSIIAVIKLSLRKYILNDMNNIEENIKELIEGNYEVEFDTKYNTELKQISDILNHWKDSYRYKDERMSRIMSSINTHSAIFECLYVINRNFFSDNIKEILGIDHKIWGKISKRPRDFEDYISSLNARDGIVKINNRFLKIVAFKKQDEFYGMIIDKTNDEEVKNRIKQQSETDTLTKLLNRHGLENRMKEIFKKDNSGILIIFDLDNFKNINDDLGHPIGDEVLKCFAKCLKKHFIEKQAIEESIISRIGGDEFVVYIDNYIEQDRITKILDRLLNCIREELKEYYEKYTLSTSIGVVYKTSNFNTYDKLYIEADKALYKAKNSGKDKFYIME